MALRTSRRFGFARSPVPSAFSHNLARRLPNLVGDTLFYADDCVADSNWTLFHDVVYHVLFAGLDYDLNPRLDLCFNLMYATLDYVRRAGAETVVFGPTADDFKLRLGCIQQRRSIDTALLNRVAFVTLSSLGKRLLPERPAPSTHHVSRDHDPCSPFYPVS